MGERVLTLPRAYLFGRPEINFNGLITDPSLLGGLDGSVLATYYAANPRRLLFQPKNAIDSVRSPTSKDLVHVVTYDIFYFDSDGSVKILVSDIDRTGPRGRSLGGLLNIGWGGHVNEMYLDPLTIKMEEALHIIMEASPEGLILNEQAINAYQRLVRYFHAYLVAHHFREMFEELEFIELPTSSKFLGWVYTPKDRFNASHIGHVVVHRMKVMEDIRGLTPAEAIKTVNSRWTQLEQILESPKQAPWTEAVVKTFVRN